MFTESRAPSKEDTKIRDRRKIFLIDREFQFRFLSTWLLMTLGFVVIIIAVLFVGLRLVKMLPGDATSAGEAITLDKLGSVLKYNAAVIILITVLLALYTIFLSHRIAGPAYRLQGCLNRIVAGDLSFTVVLRKKDYLKGIADSTNKLLQKLAERQRLIKDARADVVKLLASLESAGTDEARSLARAALERLISLSATSESEQAKV
jgi:methyl-accepting chemotaxis protein